VINRCLKWAMCGLLAAGVAAAQAFPDRPVTMVVPFGAGTSVDIHARDLSQVLGNAMGQSVITDNRAGAEGTIGAMVVLNAKPDGYTLMFTSSSVPVLDPVLKKHNQYDPIKDFAPICTVGRTSNVMNVTGSSPYKSASDVIAAAKAQPGKITFAYSTASTRLAAELFQQAAGVKFTGVPYKASSTGLTDVAGGVVDLMFIDDISAAPFYPNKSLRPLVVAGPNRVRALPDTPSATEIGVPGYSIQPWFGVFASAKTPPDVVANLRELMAKAMDTPQAKANLDKRGLVPMVVCGDEMNKLQTDEIKFWQGLIKKAGIELVD
jgi:tripartite-type tricarboxylate transporter receptor subunit TctC